MSATPLLEVKDLVAEVDGKTILDGISLTVKPGEVHAIMGPNGSGKSTLANVLAGRDDYQVVGGSVTFKGNDLFELEPEERAREGIFLAFQYPVEIYETWLHLGRSTDSFNGRLEPKLIKFKHV